MGSKVLRRASAFAVPSPRLNRTRLLWLGLLLAALAWSLYQAGFLLERKSNYVHAYALTTLVIFAAWLVRRPADVVETLVEGAGAPPGADVTVSV